MKKSLLILLTFFLSLTINAQCNQPDIPVVQFAPGIVCEGNSSLIYWTGDLNDAAKWYVYTGSCGGTLIDSTIYNSVIVYPPNGGITYYVRGEKGCTFSTTCGSVSLTTTRRENANFSYLASAYCLNGTDPIPTITGASGGSFSSSGGLIINSSTGQIDLSASTPGTYTVNYNTPGYCDGDEDRVVTINTLDNASFSYSDPFYCVNSVDPTPTISGLAGGTFSSTAGLSLNASTGKIDVSTSTPGSYTVTYTTSGACSNSSSVSVTINASYDASFSYSAAAYCLDATDPTPTITGLAGGTFSSTGGLSINSGTGQIDVSASTPGNYIVTYTTSVTCPNCSSVSLTINNSTTSTDVKVACESYTWINGMTYTVSNNTAKDTLTNSVGCDSIIYLNLTINYSNSETVAIASCYSYESPSGNYTWTTAGTYQDTILSNAGCDSIITINLTIDTTTYGSHDISSCFSYNSPSGKTWTTSGVYQDTISNISGCDSVLTIDVTILQNKKLTVMNFNDNGPGSLRDLSSGFCSGDTVLFDPITNGNPIQLTTGQIVIDKDIVIMGNDSASTIIDGEDLSRIFYIASGVTVTISNVKLQNGKEFEGGAIYNRGNLTLNLVSLTYNKAEIPYNGHTKGGAIYNTGRLTITNSSLIGNSAISKGNSNSYGGSIYNGWKGTCVMTNSVATGNCVASFHGMVLGGVIYNGLDSKFDMTNSSMSDNKANTGYFGYGGAIVNRKGVISTIDNCSLLNNYAFSKGGAIHNALSPNSITISNTTMKGNQVETGSNDVGEGDFIIR